MSQCDDILKYLQSGRTLTNAEAAALFNCYRLSGRIKDLRDMGYAIGRKDVPNKESVGYHGEYYMEGEHEGISE